MLKFTFAISMNMGMNYVPANDWQLGLTLSYLK